MAHPDLMDAAHDTWSDQATPPRGRWRGLLVWFAAWIALTALLALWRHEAIDALPYWDAAIGLLSEADFLAETNFDYERLRLREKSVWDGGSRAYVTSVLPTLLAILMKLCPTPRSVFVVYHWFTFACAAVVLLTVFRLLRGPCGTLGAALATALVAAVPIFSTQIEMLGMEMPVAAAALLWAEALLRGRPMAAVAWSALAYAFKATGGVFTAATIAFLALRLILPGTHARHARERIALVATVLLFGFELLVMRSNNIAAELITAAHRHPTAQLFVSAADWCPDLLVAFLAAALGTGILALLWLTRWKPAQGSASTWRQTLGDALAREDVGLALLCWLVVVGILLAIERVLFIPRYLTVAVPFLVMFVALLLFATRPTRKVALGALALLLAFELANQDGRFYPSLADLYGPQRGRSGALLERSLEYRADHEANQRLVALLDEKLPDEPVFVGSPLSYFLTRPSMGYVKRPHPGYLVTDFTDRQAWLRHPLVAALDDCPEAPLFVWMGNTHTELAPLFDVPRPEAGDEILFEDTQLGSPLVLFKKKWGGKTPARAEREEWYVERLLPRATPSQKATMIAAHFARRSDSARAIPALRKAIELEPRDLRLTALLARQLLGEAPDSATAGEAEQLCRYVLAIEPDDARTRLLLAAALDQQGRNEEAAAERCQAMAISSPINERPSP